MTFFEGKMSIIIDPKTWKYTKGKKFDFDLLWENGLNIVAEIALSIEEEKPGILLNKLTNPLYNVKGAEVSNTTDFIYYILFPNLELKNILSRYEKGVLDKDEFWSNLWVTISDLEGGIEFNPPPLEESKWV